MEKALSRPPLTLGNSVESKALTRKTKGGTNVNRIYAFRSWHERAKEMDYSMQNSNHFKWAEEGQPIVIMQYTGLKDKNGKDIYEGDVIKNHTPAGENHSAYDEIGVVIWDKTRIIAEQKRYGSYFSIRDGHSEVIGNIYEHPHLLAPKGIDSIAQPSEAEAEQGDSNLEPL